jgi:putative transposase
MNQKKLRRLHAEEKLQVRRQGGRKRALGTCAPMAIPQGRTNAGCWTSSPTLSLTTGSRSAS